MPKIPQNLEKTPGNRYNYYKTLNHLRNNRKEYVESETIGQQVVIYR